MEKSSAGRMPGKKILIVDDEIATLEVLEFLLTDEGYQITSAIDGRQALERLHESRPDLVILDFMMPVLDGSHVTKAMKADAKFADVPILLVSSLPEKNVRARCKGYDAFLRKPVKLPELLETISSLL
ncbi:MAG: response regulator [Candidatus Binataceae bacterium]